MQTKRTYFTVGIMFCCGFSSRKRYHKHLPYTFLIFFNRICSVKRERLWLTKLTKQKSKHGHLTPTRQYKVSWRTNRRSRITRGKNAFYPFKWRCPCINIRSWSDYPLYLKGICSIFYMPHSNHHMQTQSSPNMHLWTASATQVPKFSISVCMSATACRKNKQTERNPQANWCLYTNKEYSRSNSSFLNSKHDALSSSLWHLLL